ncbi:hypothetical protein Bhyg_06901 [Pseudolycoriella hygida]|uniref:Uncharacterized protein n=1 Tax=Pseudolycoriella hygida TaxID=35572 RepID=A0A9Q0N262_9DIPT|nr:hypothetical protein Bhyg_06901 [Pseudolycoriella hygida]
MQSLKGISYQAKKSAEEWIAIDVTSPSTAQLANGVLCRISNNRTFLLLLKAEGDKNSIQRD